MAGKQTLNYNMSVYDSEDNQGTFLEFRTSIAGSQATSNFVIIDTEMARLADEIEDLSKSSTVVYAYGTKNNSINYVATVSDLTEYINNMLLVVALDENNEGQTSLRINDLDSIYIKRYDNEGQLLDVTANELVKDRNYLLRFNGTYFILISPVVATDFKMNGTAGNLLSITSDNRIGDSGSSIQSINNSINTKISKVSSPTADNIPVLESDGSIKDSGSSLQTINNNINGKISKVSGATAGNIPIFKSDGTIEDSTSNFNDLASRVSGATSGHLAGLDSSGNLTDSGKTVSDFVQSVNNIEPDSSGNVDLGITSILFTSSEWMTTSGYYTYVKSYSSGTVPWPMAVYRLSNGSYDEVICQIRRVESESGGSITFRARAAFDGAVIVQGG